jgi:putative tricarboxylic transport membrane protein
MRTQSRLNTLFARRSLLVVGLACGAALTGAAAAQVKGIDITAPAGPGGGYDQLARATQQVLQKEGLASGVQVSNVPGAGGTIGLAQFVTGKKRGNNLMVAGLGLVGAVLTNKASITLDQVTPLARLQGEYQPLVVAADSPIKTLNDLISKYKADPGSVSWGGFALGSPDHILSGLIVKAIGGDATKMNYIVAGAGGEMLAQVMGGHITVATGGLNEFAQQLESGKLRALAISSPERLPGINIPTLKEQGVNVELVNWRGLMAPREIRPADKKALEDAIGMMVKSAAWQDILKERGWVDSYMPSDQFAAFIKEEQVRIESLLKEAGLIK